MHKILLTVSSLLVFFPAFAETPADQNPIVAFLPLAVILFVFYFLAIRPQQKKQKAHKKMISEIKAGDEIVSASGFYGKITKLSANYMDCEIAKGISIKMQKNAITQVLPKGTIENLE